MNDDKTAETTDQPEDAAPAARETATDPAAPAEDAQEQKEAEAAAAEAAQPAAELSPGAAEDPATPAILGYPCVYRLSERDAAAINQARTNTSPNQDFQRHSGNPCREGDDVACTIAAVHSPSMINGQCLLDGNDSHWVTSVPYGNEPGRWRWAERPASA